MKSPEEWDELLTLSPMNTQEALRSVRIKPEEIAAIQDDARGEIKSELEKCRVACAAMREALEQSADLCSDMISVSWNENSEVSGGSFIQTFDACKSALSTDCGQSFLDRLNASEQRVKELVELLRESVGYIEGSSDVLEEFGGLACGCGESGPCVCCQCSTQIKSNAEFVEGLKKCIPELHKAIGEVK